MPPSSLSTTTAPLPSSPQTAAFPTTHLLQSAGIAIFHLSTARVVLCRHPSNPRYFLPKGRKNASEPITTTAVREGYEESGYRCRLLSLPLPHVQTLGEGPDPRFVVEPVWTQLLPVADEVQYLLFWFVGETLDAEEEGRCNAQGDGWVLPMGWRGGMTVVERREMDREGDGWREPVCHPDTGVDGDEMLYEKFLVPVEEAIRLLKGGVMTDVVRKGWAAIRLRAEMEEKDWEDEGR
ncbi:hypothetical protein CAC42_5242 [Sphaceloma murrayae]|uniref:Nudix hydrolase domain-containing protein n=1 Tax=Sphaceloma murrayae TaxID=2082308 RepID=A0A2K1QUZ4_9PEZI|nr:hypothetical protein CAC42_5242 [Sphaceloma murrayae]